MITKAEKTAVIEANKTHEGDTGSPEVQITIALFLVTKQIAVLLTGGALLLCAIVGIFVLTQAFGKRLSQFTTDLCQTLDHMIAGNEAPQRPEDSETQDRKSTRLNSSHRLESRMPSSA